MFQISKNFNGNNVFQGYSYVAPSIVYGENNNTEDCLKTTYDNRPLSAAIRQASFFEVKSTIRNIKNVIQPELEGN